LSSPFDLRSIELLCDLGLEIFKIPSGEITNLPYLRKIGGLKKEIILSTGMADLSEIEEALEILDAAGTPRGKITVLHCNTEYPTPMPDVNLKAMQTIARAFRVRVGYSDHTLGIEVPIAAVTLGAGMIEKHFTLEKNLPGPDHQSSLEPHELKAMVQAIRNIEMALGSGIKRPSASEIKNIPIVRKSIVAARNIYKGEVLTEGNVTVKRPGIGISPMQWDRVIGKKAMKDFQVDDLIILNP
jgi:N,N'-diacetyllegionaminate synthase